MIYSGRKAVTTAGVKVALADTRTMAGWVTVCADKDNVGIVYVGGSNVANASAPGGYMGHPLLQGEFLNLREMGGPSYLDLRYIYIDVDTSDDAVTFNYGRR
jgi:hypothetical protein